MFSLSMLSSPGWLWKPESSSWDFTTSESAEFDALIFAAGKGSFYVIDDNDADGIVHEILYVGAGVRRITNDGSSDLRCVNKISHKAFSKRFVVKVVCPS
jgi:hypothetical protein